MSKSLLDSEMKEDKFAQTFDELNAYFEEALFSPSIPSPTVSTEQSEAEKLANTDVSVADCASTIDPSMLQVSDDHESKEEEVDFADLFGSTYPSPEDAFRPAEPYPAVERAVDPESATRKPSVEYDYEAFSDMFTDLTQVDMDQAMDNLATRGFDSTFPDIPPTITPSPTTQGESSIAPQLVRPLKASRSPLVSQRANSNHQKIQTEPPGSPPLTAKRTAPYPISGPNITSVRRPNVQVTQLRARPTQPHRSISPEFQLTRAQHHRPANIEPSKNYVSPPQRLKNWDVFEYNQFGELAPGKVYTAAELERFIFLHPLHNTPIGYCPKQSGLTLWIQRAPVDSERRSSCPAAARCRFKGCPTPYNLIEQGQVRVAFDEQTRKFPYHDPQRNAGYIHLYCLEQAVNFPKICTKLPVLPEGRNLPMEVDGRNRMLLASYQELNLAWLFISFCRDNGKPPPFYPDYRMPNRSYEGTLLHQFRLLNEETPEFAQSNVWVEASQWKNPPHLGNLAHKTGAQDQTSGPHYQKSTLRTTGNLKRRFEETLEANEQGEEGDLRSAECIVEAEAESKLEKLEVKRRGLKHRGPRIHQGEAKRLRTLRTRVVYEPKSISSAREARNAMRRSKRSEIS